jgi:hypothetical protein
LLLDLEESQSSDFCFLLFLLLLQFVPPLFEFLLYQSLLLPNPFVQMNFGFESLSLSFLNLLVCLDFEVS